MSIDAEGWAGLLAMRKAPRYEGELPKAAIEAASLETRSAYGASRFGTYERCPREHALRYRDGVIPKDRLFDRLDYFSLGSTLHAILSYAWRGFQLGEARDWRDALQACTLREGSIDDDVFQEAERLGAAYFAHYGEPDWQDGAKILAIEELIGDEASFDLPYTARLDLILEVAGQIVIVDTKTRAHKVPDDRVSFARDQTASAQFLGQCHLVMKHYGLAEPPTVIINAIVKTKIPSFARVPVRPTLRDVEMWRANHAEIAREDFSSARMNYHSCAPALGSRCGYFRWCHGSDEERSRHFETKASKP